MKIRERWFYLFRVLILLVSVSSCFAQEKKQGITPHDFLDKESKEFLEELDKAFLMIKQYYVEDVDSKKIYEGALRGMMGALDDPHSVYWDQGMYQEMKKGVIQGDYGGVGLYINKPNPKALNADAPITDFYINIVAPIRGTPGYAADLHAGDYITHIDGESVVELNSDQAVGKLTGEVGSEVLITVLRNESIVFDVTLKREKISVPTTESAMIKKGLAYMRISSWSQHTAKDVLKLLQNFEEEGYQSLIIDLRENGGGLLDSAVQISNYFISKGDIVSTRYRSTTDFPDQVFSADSFQTKVNSKLPIVVLIDKGSASASEIFAGAMQDSKRATIIGSTSYGKGSIQIPFPLRYNDSIKMTVGRYYTPSGKNIDKVGIIPDIEVEEEVFAEEELASFQKLMNEKLIDKYVAENPTPNKTKEDLFLSELKKQEISLKDRYVRKLIKNKYNRKMDFPPVYDLEFDITLQKAVEFLSNKK